jgi:amino acid adenylation domain-containing protein
VKKLLQNWITQQAQRRPDAVAVVMEGERMTYGQLESQSNRLARVLKNAGCGQGDRVAFAIPKSPAAIVAIAGILKANCIHVPLDTASPAPRVTKFLRSSQPRLLLGTSGAARLIEEIFSQAELREALRLGWMEETVPQSPNVKPEFTTNDFKSHLGEPVDSSSDANDAAHILFTSGSTGEPKGVVITHANVIHFVEWATRYFGTAESDRISCHPPLHFDLATFDIFGAFAVGAQLHLVPATTALLPNKLAEFIRESELTQWFSVPSVLNYMAKFDVVGFNDFPALRRLLWCGEVFPTTALMYWMKRLPHVSFTNLYGPTETTIASSYYTVPACPVDSSETIPIGKACDGENLMVLDAELRTVERGEVGDLYIGGAGLSPGYWNDASATSTAFISANGHGRIYRTGDLAKVGEDGLIQFVGRSDTQIKSRGYRIELGEIEAAMNAIAETKECAVVSIPTDGFENNLICCAYVPQEKTRFTPRDLLRQLYASLPAYMLPSQWREMSELPKNANGKIDRRKIQELFQSEATKQHAAGTLK